MQMTELLFCAQNSPHQFTFRARKELEFDPARNAPLAGDVPYFFESFFSRLTSTSSPG